MAKKDIVVFSLNCTKCKRKNYTFRRNKRKLSEKKVEVKKFCSFCRKHIIHKEGKA